MNTQMLHTSAWGRILLLLRADYYEYRRVFGAIIATTALCVLLLPQVPLLFGGTIYESWVLGAIASGTVSSVRSIGMLAISLYILYYWNRRTQHACPIGFSLSPAQVWEKAASMALFALSIQLVWWIVMLLCDVVNYLTIPVAMQIHWTDGLIFGEELSQGPNLRGSMMYACAPVFTQFINVIVALVYFIGMISFRGYTKGVLISTGALALGTWVISSLGIAHLRFWLATYTDVVHIPQIEPWGLIDIKVTLVTFITLSAIIGVEIWYLLRKLSSIQS